MRCFPVRVRGRPPINIHMRYSEITDLNEIEEVGISVAPELIRHRFRVTKNKLKHLANIASFELYGEKWPMTKDMNSFFFLDGYGNPIGSSTLQFMGQGRLYSVKMIQIIDEYQRKGIGLAFYSFLIRNGYHLISDSEHSSKSKALWRKLMTNHTLYLSDHTMKPLKKVDTEFEFELAYDPDSKYTKLIAKK